MLVPRPSRLHDLIAPFFIGRHGEKWRLTFYEPGAGAKARKCFISPIKELRSSSIITKSEFVVGCTANRVKMGVREGVRESNRAS